MTAPGIHHISPPQPRAWIRLPDRAGTIRGYVKAIEIRADGTAWVLITVPQWVREGDSLAPGLVDMWAPVEAAEYSEGDDIEQVKRIMRGEVTPAFAQS